MLLEGVYTYVAFRRLGAMADGMHQLLEIARAGGAKAALTYVAADYPPSIRGCANVGFILDHVAVTKRRLFARRVVFVPADDEARSAWEAATAPRRRRPHPTPRLAQVVEVGFRHHDGDALDAQSL